MTTIVAKVEAVGPAAYVTDLGLLENRFEFQRALRTLMTGSLLAQLVEASTAATSGSWISRSRSARRHRDRAAPHVRVVAGHDDRRHLGIRRARAGWYWNTIACGEHTGTHFDAPVHWITGRICRRVPATRFPHVASSVPRA